jgi:hypothetical protein
VAQSEYLLELRNHGAGCALNIEVSPLILSIAFPNEVQTLETKFTLPQNFLGRNARVTVEATTKRNGAPVSDLFQSWFSPHLPGGAFSIEIEFDDIEGQRYALRAHVAELQDQTCLYPRAVKIGKIERLWFD